MVSGLFIPTIGAYVWKRGSSAGALAGMISGGTLTLLLMTKIVTFPKWSLDPCIYGIVFSSLLYVCISLFAPDPAKGLYDGTE
jgi:SSS family solute:Na+ symporter